MAAAGFSLILRSVLFLSPTRWSARVCQLVRFTALWPVFWAKAYGPLRLTRSILMQKRASLSSGKAVRVDDISSQVLEALLWRAVQKLKGASERRYLGYSKESIETWLKNVVVLLPKKVGIERMEGQTRGLCVQSVVAKWCCGYIDHFVGHPDEDFSKGRKSYFWVRRGRSATEISTAMGFLASAGEVIKHSKSVKRFGCVGSCVLQKKIGFYNGKVHIITQVDFATQYTRAFLFFDCLLHFCYKSIFLSLDKRFSIPHMIPRMSGEVIWWSLWLLVMCSRLLTSLFAACLFFHHAKPWTSLYIA